MDMASLPTILLILAAISIGGMVIAILIAFRSHREAESAIFPIVREEESIRAQRARISIFIWVAITALFLGGWLATFRLTAPGDTDKTDTVTSNQSTQIDQPAKVDQPTEVAIQEPATETPLPVLEPSPTTNAEPEVQPLTSAATPTNTPAPPPSPTPTEPPPATFTSEPSSTFTPTSPPPTATPTETPVPPTDTPTPIPPTETSTLAALEIPTSAPRTPAPPVTKMGPIQFAEDITPDIEPVNPNTVFLNGIAKVYAVYPFNGIQKGIDFTVVWYQNGVEIDRTKEEWPWGQRGRGYMFLVPRGKGLYKLELYVNDTVVATGLFEVQ